MIQLQEFTGLWAVFRQSVWGGENQICPVSTLGPPALKPSIPPLTQGERRTDLQAPATLVLCAHLFQASILDLHSGALSVGKHFVNLYR